MSIVSWKFSAAAVCGFLDDYYATSDEQTFEELAGTFDLIVNTVSAHLPMDQYLALLGLNGTLVHVGIPDGPDEYQAFSLAGMRRSMAGSKIGGIRSEKAMSPVRRSLA